MNTDVKSHDALTATEAVHVSAAAAGNTKEPFIEHMEYYGYDAEVLEEGEGDYVCHIIFRHPQKYSISFVINRNSVGFLTSFPANPCKVEHADMEKVYRCINRINNEMVITKLSYDSREQRLIFTVNAMHTYDKRLFACMIDCFQNDIEISIDMSEDMQNELLQAGESNGGKI